MIVASGLKAANDSTMFKPLVAATEANLVAAGRHDGVGAYAADAADARYWSVRAALSKWRLICELPIEALGHRPPAAVRAGRPGSENETAGQFREQVWLPSK